MHLALHVSLTGPSDLLDPELLISTLQKVNRLTKSILFLVLMINKQSFYFKDCDFTQLLHAIRVLGGVLDKPGHKLKLIIVENSVSARYT